MKIKRIVLVCLYFTLTNAVASTYPWAQSNCLATDNGGDSTIRMIHGKKSTALITQLNSPVDMRCTWQNKNRVQAQTPNMRMMLLIDSAVPYVKADCTFNSAVVNRTITDIRIPYLDVVWQHDHQQIDALVQVFLLTDTQSASSTRFSSIQFNGNNSYQNKNPRSSTEHITFTLENNRTHLDADGRTGADIVFWMNNDYFTQNQKIALSYSNSTYEDFNDGDNIICTFTPMDKP